MHHISPALCCLNVGDVDHLRIPLFTLKVESGYAVPARSCIIITIDVTTNLELARDAVEKPIDYGLLITARAGSKRWR